MLGLSSVELSMVLSSAGQVSSVHGSENTGVAQWSMILKHTYSYIGCVSWYDIKNMSLFSNPHFNI